MRQIAQRRVLVPGPDFKMVLGDGDGFSAAIDLLNVRTILAE
jgi:hypothetical protein